MPYYIGEDDSAVAIIRAQALTRGEVKWIGDQCGLLYDPKGQKIGSFYRSLSPHGGWSVWTVPYAGWARPDEVEIRPCPNGDACEFAHMHYPISDK